MLKLVARQKPSWVWLFLVVALLSCVMAPGCTSKKKREANKPPETETSLYRSARKSLAGKNYLIAIEKFQQLETLFPFGRYAEQAQLEIVFAHHKARNLTEAKVAADRFIQLNPQHANADYAQYLKALSSFTDGRKSFELSAKRGILNRDISSLQEAYKDFQVLLEVYPHSEYAQDTRQHMIFIRNILAAKEVLIGQFYLDQKAYLAAANRGQYVLENFSQTPAIEDALRLMSDAYLFMGKEHLAKKSIELLRLNYPDHPNFGPNNVYIATASKKSLTRSLMNVLTFGILARPKPPKPIVFNLDEPSQESLTP